MIMNELHYTIFFLALPIMCLLSYLIMATVWLFGKRREEAKKLLMFGIGGAILGYIAATLYFFITRNEDLSAVLSLGSIGLLVGSGYSMILFSILPKKYRSM